MLRHIRTFFAALAVTALLATPGFAGTNIDSLDAGPASPVTDALVLRPLGLAMLGVSAALWVPAAAVTAIVRPSELDMTIERMLVEPARFVFVDPLGTH